MKPQQRMGLTRWVDLLAVTALAGVIGYGLVYFSYRNLPRLPLLAGMVPALVGVGLMVLGWTLRRRIRVRDGQRTEPLPALLAGRIVMVAKASALAGGALTGLWLGVVAYLIPKSDLAAAVADRISGLVGVVGAVLLTAGALILEWCCRAPEDSDGPEPL